MIPLLIMMEYYRRLLSNVKKSSQAAQPLEGMRFKSSSAIRSADKLKLAFLTLQIASI